MTAYLFPSARIPVHYRFGIDGARLQSKKELFPFHVSEWSRQRDDDAACTGLSQKIRIL